MLQFVKTSFKEENAGFNSERSVINGTQKGRSSKDFKTGRG